MSRFTFSEPKHKHPAKTLFPAWLAQYVYIQLHACFKTSHIIAHIKLRLWMHHMVETLLLSDHENALLFLSNLSKTLVCSDGQIILSDNDRSVLKPSKARQSMASLNKWLPPAVQADIYSKG